MHAMQCMPAVPAVVLLDGAARKPLDDRVQLHGRRALVTGGGRGIGRAVALRLAGAGADVVVGARTRQQVEAVAQEVRQLGREALALDVDVASPDSVESLFGRAREAFGHLDVVVAAAGVAASAPLAKTDDATWRSVIETNLSGTFYCLRAALPGMTERGWGRVVAIASIASRTGARYISAYAASKHGVLGLVRCAALEVAKAGVTVNAVCPGYVDTPMTDASVENITQRTGKPPAEVRAYLESQSPQNRMVSADEVAALTAFLCGPDAGGINGQALGIDGGTVL